VSPEDVKEIVRVEMRKFRRSLYDVQFSGNHDADKAIEQVRKALDQQFPESPAELAARIGAYVIERAIRDGDNYDLQLFGQQMGMPRAKDESFEDYGARLLRRHKELGGH
jgi:hypothetical protein